MRPYRASYAPLTTSATGIASAIEWAAGGYVLSAAGAGDNLAHIITITGKDATDHSGKTFTVTGTSAEGDAVAESIVGPVGTATVSTTKHFKTVTSVTVSATTEEDTFDIGWTAVAVGSVYGLNWRAEGFDVSLALTITGTISATVQHTFDQIHGEQVAAPVWFPHSSLVTKTASADGNYAFPVIATRLLINSVTNGATVLFQVVQGH